MNRIGSWLLTLRNPSRTVRIVMVSAVYGVIGCLAGLLAAAVDSHPYGSLFGGVLTGIFVGFYLEAAGFRGNSDRRNKNRLRAV